MNEMSGLAAPETLVKGMSYRLSWENENGNEAEEVVFLGYSPCPAVVVVQGQDGRIWRCDRSKLFVPCLAARQQISPISCGSMMSSVSMRK